MTKLLIKLFVKNKDDIKNNKVRQSYSILASIFGIISNFFIFLLKIIVGLIFNIISITADAVNNLSDASNSIISLISAKISTKPADKEHPFGHARSEYIAGFLVALLIGALGIVLVISSCQDIYQVAIGQKIKNRLSNLEFILTCIILSISILLKIYQAIFNSKIGSIIKSDVLKLTAFDSRNDVIATSLVLIGTIINQYVNLGRISLDGILGLLVGLFITFSSYKLIINTLDPLLGQSPDPALIKEFTKKIYSFKAVLGIHDIQMHSYGPNCIFATCHVEIDASMDMIKAHEIIDSIERACLHDLKIITTIHMDPRVLNDPLQDEIEKKVNSLIKELNFPCSIHDFRIIKGAINTNVIFDLLIPIDLKLTNNQIKTILNHKITELNPHYYPYITIDRDYNNLLEKK